MQAQELGYASRQIGSFDALKVKAIFSELKSEFIPFVLIAMGKMGTETDYANTTADILEKEMLPWERKENITTELK
ncbi:MAG: hypothetical protein WCJ58_07385 [bacterium]